MDLLVHELFYALQGETLTAGFPSLFIRLAGCNLHCDFCDTPEARTGGKPAAIGRIVDLVRGFAGIHHVTVTGGEPLCQVGTGELLRRLVDAGFRVQLETNGSLPLDLVPACVGKMTDVKTPSSGHAGSFLMQNLEFMGAGDEFKFVIGDLNDYEFSRGFVREHLADAKSPVNFSPAWGNLPAATLAEWIVRDRLVVRLNVQLHKVLWGGAGENKVVIPI